MSKITEKELISRIRMFKDIKPNKQWADIALSKIMDSKEQNIIAPKANFMSDIVRGAYAIMMEKRFAYSLALFAFVISGVFSFTKFTVPGDTLFIIKKLAEQSQSTLIGQTEIKENIASLHNRINDLAEVSKQGKKQNVPSAVNEIASSAVALKKSLNENSADQKDIKEIANSLKTLASVSGESGVNVTENTDVNDLYKTVVLNQIDDLQQAMLTDIQKDQLKVIGDLYEKGEYAQALEMIVGINK